MATCDYVVEDVGISLVDQPNGWGNSDLFMTIGSFEEWEGDPDWRGTSLFAEQQSTVDSSQRKEQKQPLYCSDSWPPIQRPLLPQYRVLQMSLPHSNCVAISPRIMTSV